MLGTLNHLIWASMSAAPNTEVKWQEYCNDKAGASSEGLFNLDHQGWKGTIGIWYIVFRNPANWDTWPAYHFFSLPLSPWKFPLEGTGAKQESKSHLLAARVQILNKSWVEVWALDSKLNKAPYFPLAQIQFLSSPTSDWGCMEEVKEVGIIQLARCGLIY